MASAQTSAPPGWYLDPTDPSMERHWDGSSWQPYLRPAGPRPGHVDDAAPAAGAPVQAQAEADRGSPWAALAIAIGAIAMFLLPLILGPIALLLAGVAVLRHEPMRFTALQAAVGGTVVGLLLQQVVWSSLG